MPDPWDEITPATTAVKDPWDEVVPAADPAPPAFGSDWRGLVEAPMDERKALLSRVGRWGPGDDQDDAAMEATATKNGWAPGTWETTQQKVSRKMRETFGVEAPSSEEIKSGNERITIEEAKHAGWREWAGIKGTIEPTLAEAQMFLERRAKLERGPDASVPDIAVAAANRLGKAVTFGAFDATKLSLAGSDSAASAQRGQAAMDRTWGGRAAGTAIDLGGAILTATPAVRLVGAPLGFGMQQAARTVIEGGTAKEAAVSGFMAGAFIKTAGVLEAGILQHLGRATTRAGAAGRHALAGVGSFTIAGQMFGSKDAALDALMGAFLGGGGAMLRRNPLTGVVTPEWRAKVEAAAKADPTGGEVARVLDEFAAATEAGRATREARKVEAAKNPVEAPLDPWDTIAPAAEAPRAPQTGEIEGARPVAPPRGEPEWTDAEIREIERAQQEDYAGDAHARWQERRLRAEDAEVRRVADRLVGDVESRMAAGADMKTAAREAVNAAEDTLDELSSRREGAIEAMQARLDEAAQRRGTPYRAPPVSRPEPPVEAAKPTAPVPPAEAPPPAAGATRAGERGFLGLGTVGPTAQVVSDAVVREVGPIISRVRRTKGGGPVATEAADKGDKAVSEAKGAAGEMAVEGDAALRATADSPLTKRGRAAFNLAKDHPDPGNPDVAFSRWHEGIEGKTTLTKVEEGVADPVRRLIDKRGQIYEANDAWQFDSSTGTWALFKNIPGGKVAPRIRPPEYHDIITEGPKGAAWKPLIDAHVYATGRSRAEVESVFLAEHRESNAEGPDSALFRTQAETRRQWPRVPSAIKVNGSWIPLLETRPHEYVRRLIQLGAARVGVMKAIGQDVPGQKGIADLRQRFVEETGDAETFVEFARGLHGISPKKPVLPTAAAGHPFVQGGKNVGALGRTALVSSSAVPNVFEFFGATRTFLGPVKFAQAMADVMAGNVERGIAWASGGRIPKAFGGGPTKRMSEVEAIGAATRAVADFSADPRHPVGQVVRMWRELQSRLLLYGPIGEAQEYATVLGTKRAADAWKAGKGGAVDRQRLMTFGFSYEDAGRIVKGGGTPAEYDAIVRMAPGRLVGANLSPVEKSNFESRRGLIGTIPLKTYASMAVRDKVRNINAWLETLSKNADPTISAKDAWKGSVAATGVLLDSMLGAAATGAASVLAYAYVAGGKPGLDATVARAKDDPLAFAGEALYQTLFAGPYGQSVKVIKGEQGVEQLSLPVMISVEIVNALSQEGRYADEPDITSRMAALALRFFPARRAFHTMAVAIGLGSPEAQEIGAARKAYFDWKRDRGLMTRTEFGDEGQEWRSAMRRAYKAATEYDTPEDVEKHLLAAYGLKGDWRKVKASLKSRMILGDSDVKQRADDLRSYIGPRAYKALEAHDALLLYLAESNDPEGAQKQGAETLEGR